MRKTCLRGSESRGLAVFLLVMGTGWDKSWKLLLEK